MSDVLNVILAHEKVVSILSFRRFGFLCLSPSSKECSPVHTSYANQLAKAQVQSTSNQRTAMHGLSAKYDFVALSACTAEAFRNTATLS